MVYLWSDNINQLFIIGEISQVRNCKLPIIDKYYLQKKYNYTHLSFRDEQTVPFIVKVPVVRTIVRLKLPKIGCSPLSRPYYESRSIVWNFHFHDEIFASSLVVISEALDLNN